MNKKIFFIIISLLFVSFVGKSQSANIILTNATGMSRPDELIVLTRQQLTKKLGSIEAKQFVRINNKNTPVLVQYDDIDGDGQWDELAFLQSFKAKEKIALQLFLANTPATIKTVVRASARHKRKNDDDSFGNNLLIDSIPPGQLGADFSKVKLPPFLTEGPAWENDKVGFRIYFDVRNAKDIWGKTTSAMVLDDVGVNPENNYHQIAPWGMDILKVGSSLGAGALALKYKVNNNDTIVRLGGVNMGPVFYKQIASGPIRATISLHYPKWKINESGKLVSVTEQISIWGGQYFYQSAVIVANAPTGSELITGIVNLKSKELLKSSNAGNSFVATYDVQSENNDQLGMAILYNNKYVTTGQTANANSDVLNTYFAAFPINKGNKILFRFYAGWEQSEKEFRSKKGFLKYINEQSLLQKAPIIIQ